MAFECVRYLNSTAILGTKQIVCNPINLKCQLTSLNMTIPDDTSSTNSCRSASRVAFAALRQSTSLLAKPGNRRTTTTSLVETLEGRRPTAGGMAK